MKKIFIILLMLCAIPVFADTMPFYVNSIPKASIGVYQTGNSLTLYNKPEENAQVIKKMEFSYKTSEMPDGVFAVLLNEKQLGFLYVTDIDEDGWVEVIYDKHTGARGWVQTEDKMQFLPWRNFYNLYGRKYGIRIFKDTPKDLYTLRAKSEDNSQGVSKLNYVKKMKLTKVQGNWALVTVQDLDEVPKTGYLKWRDSDGTVYAFPDLK